VQSAFQVALHLSGLRVYQDLASQGPLFVDLPPGPT
jgi:hypothetical protein